MGDKQFAVTPNENIHWKYMVETLENCNNISSADRPISWDNQVLETHEFSVKRYHNTTRTLDNSQ